MRKNKNNIFTELTRLKRERKKLKCQISLYGIGYFLWFCCIIIILEYLFYAGLVILGIFIIYKIIKSLYKK